MPPPRRVRTDPRRSALCGRTRLARPADGHPPRPGLLVVLPPREPGRAGPSPRRSTSTPTCAGLPFVPKRLVDGEGGPSIRTSSPTWSPRSMSASCSPPIRPRPPAGRSPTSDARSPSSCRIDRTTPAPPIADRRRIDRHVSEAIDLLWQTDELRLENDPRPSTRPAAVLAVLDDLASNVMGTLLEDVRHAAWPPASDPGRRRFRPIRFGTWVGGDRDGNPIVTAGGHPRGARPPAVERDRGAASPASTR